MYNCLPMYHSVGGVLATGAVLVGGGSVVIRRTILGAAVLEDVVGWDCTLFQYIGELCRYLLHSAPHPRETDHRLRLCCGNGLRGDVWDVFKDRFRIPQILEFYAVDRRQRLAGRMSKACPAPSAGFRRSSRTGSPATLVKYDEQTAAPRARRPRILRAAARRTRVGEAIGRLRRIGRTSAAGSRATPTRGRREQRILRDVFEPGDAWCRTGDLMRRDERGYFYFVDRIGDTFRWKGENVATTEVAERDLPLSGHQGGRRVRRARFPAPTAAPAWPPSPPAGGFDPAAFRAHVVAALPHYARPLFVRVCDAVDATATFKHTTTALMRDGYDPGRIADALYVDDGERQTYVRLDTSLYDRIQSGQLPGSHHHAHS